MRADFRGRILTHAAAGFVCLLVLLPLVWAVTTSFRPPEEMTSLSPIPSAPTLDNYRVGITELGAPRLLINSVAMAVTVSTVQIALVVLAAFGFTQFRFRGRSALFLGVLFTLLVPNQITIVPSYLIAARLGWVDTFQGLVVPQMASLAFGIFLVRQHLLAFPTDLRAAAEMDGATHWDLLWRVIVPALRPVLVSLWILLFLSSWNEYLWPLLIIDDSGWGTIQPGLQSFVTEEGTAWGPLMAATVLVTAPILAIYVVAQRRVIATFMQAGIR